MRLVILCMLFTLTWASAQTLGDTLDDMESRTSALIARHPSPSGWGEETALDDLRRLQAQAARLGAALEGDDAGAVEDLQRGLSTAARRVETSSVLLAPEDGQAVSELLSQAGQVDSRLTELRLRFGGKASMVGAPLASLPLVEEQSPDEIYPNLPALLVDVRDARRLASTLGNNRFPAQGIVYGTLNNLDPLQVRRLVQAGFDLERDLSSGVSDVRQSIPSWLRFRAEYRRLGYPGTGSNVRRLDRVMRRLDEFYSRID